MIDNYLHHRDKSWKVNPLDFKIIWRNHLHIVEFLIFITF